VLDAQTVATLRSIFAGVVERGTGKPAAVEGYAVGGKTGTAQKAAAGGYSHSKIVASFVGFVPVEEPQLAILVMLDEPQISRWGSQAAGPVFRRVAQEALRYLQIPPQLAKPLTVVAASPPSPGEPQVVQGTATPAVARAGQRMAQIRE
jgi:cell division protein FtsI/penicillin-binding protein 2